MASSLATGKSVSSRPALILAALVLVSLGAFLVAAIWAHEPWLEVSQSHAERLLKARRYAQAANVSRRLVERSPRDSNALFTLARALAGGGDLSGAVEALRKIPDWSLRKDDALLFEAKIQLERRRGRDAERALRACIDRERSSASPATSARLELFALYGMEERHDEFRALFWSTFPLLAMEDRLPVLTMRIKLEFEQTEPEINAEILSAYLENDPLDADARSGLAAALDHAGDTEGARREWEQALRDAPDNAGIRERLLDLLLRLGDRDAFDRVLKEMPLEGKYRAESQKMIGLDALAKGDLNAALVAFQRAVELRPDVAEHHHRLSQVLARLGRLDDAAEAAEKRAQLNEARERLRLAWIEYADAFDAQPDHVPRELIDRISEACRESGLTREGEAFADEAARREQFQAASQRVDKRSSDR